MSGEDMDAEGRILEEEAQLEKLVEKAIRMQSKGYGARDIEMSLKSVRPSNFQIKTWNMLVRSALEYV